NQPNKNKVGSNNVWLVVIAVIVLGGVGWFALRATQTPPPEEQRAQQVQTPMKMSTLPPATFTGKAREAYQAALDVPDVLRQVQCYCGCRQSEGHQNNLFCFRDEHAVG